MSKPLAHLMIATPTYTGDVCSDYANSIALGAAHCILRNIWVEPRYAAGFSLVEYARNWLVAEFLSMPKATHLFWIDSDLFFPPNALAKLVSRDRDVIAGVYPTKSDDDSIYPYTALGPVIDGVQEAERVPGGFLCMKRAAVEKVAMSCDWHEIKHNGVTRPAPRFFDLKMIRPQRVDIDIGGTIVSKEVGELVGEDFIAGARLRKAGFKLYVETDLNFKHYGRKGWMGNLQKQLEIEAGNGYTGQGASEAWERNVKEKLE